MNPRSVPELTSAEAWDDYNVGKRIAVSRGPAWRDVRLSVFELPQAAETFTMPAVTEPFIAWAASGHAEFQEREGKAPWKTTRVKKGTLFVTAGGAPYDMRWRSLGVEPFEAVLVIISMPLFSMALDEVFGAKAAHSQERHWGQVSTSNAVQFHVAPGAGNDSAVRGLTLPARLVGS